jgi:hypothetical protein
MASKNWVVLDLNAKVKVVEASEKDKLTMKQIVGKFRIGKTQVYNILKLKSGIKRGWLTGNENEMKKAGNKNINKIVWDWFDSTRARKNVSLNLNEI